MKRRLQADLACAASDLLILDGWRALKPDPISDPARAKNSGELGMADS
jgi:hypothetical protein